MAHQPAHARRSQTLGRGDRRYLALDGTPDPGRGCADSLLLVYVEGWRGEVRKISTIFAPRASVVYGVIK